ncbi:glycosyltransferase family 2 protein [Olivibacter sp. XZL3]|uniref:glycosyltransferase family 2 protein n=1 Tax=Olivibacter sp. XZL3 TaxID=1735116 RepID=UPI0010659723|nr:glycosyltransferase family 2 protein [Olivibacter sp. XZL3]
MPALRTPKWIKQYDFSFNKFEEIPPSLFASINKKLDRLQASPPLVSIVITAWNEETNLVKTIASMADFATEVPLEIIVVDNNSTDRTADTLAALHVKHYFQPIQGWGPGRQMGLDHAQGKYLLSADADVLYPKKWVDDMLHLLEEPNVVAVYGRYSFIPEKGYPRWKLYLYERLKDTIASFRHLKRPHLNAYGMSFGYVTAHAKKIGYVMEKIRGEDGRLCFDLMQYGEVKQLKKERSRVWTKPRTLKQDGSLWQATRLRIKKEANRFITLMRKQELHDTKTSKND